jgi:Tfp pilus assembly protein PilN
MSNGFNFARAPFVNERLPRLLFGLFLFFVAALTAVHGYLLTRNLLREREALDAQVDGIRQEIRETDAAIEQITASLSQDRTAVGNEKTRFLTRLYRRKAFSWTGLFNELENIAPGAVRVTSIVPTEDDDVITVTMTVVGRTLADILELVKALESSSFFTTVFPVDESNADEAAGRGAGIAATLQLRYVEDSRPSEAKDAEP